MPCLKLHIADATLAAGLRRGRKQKVWPYLLAIGVAVGVLATVSVESVAGGRLASPPSCQGAGSQAFAAEVRSVSAGH